MPTIRPKNQVTIPSDVLAQAGLKQGDPIEFSTLPDGGVVLYRHGHRQHRESVWDLAARLAAAAPGIEDTDLDLPPRSLERRDVTL